MPSFIKLSLVSLFLTAFCRSNPIPTFQPYPEKIDLLVVVAHPDDESTFGGLLPHYAQGQGKRIVIVSLTSGEWGNGLPHHTKPTDAPDYSYDDSDQPRFVKIPADTLYPSYYREGEMARMTAASGVKYLPIMPRFKDMAPLQPWNQTEPAFELWGGRERVVGYVVEQIRRFKPDVIVTMAVNGFNGNPAHMGASRATVLAAQVAGDPDAFLDPGKPLEPWAPSKVYQHVGPGESYDIVHTHDWELPAQGMTETPRVIAARANALHESQLMPNECPASSDFVLVQTAVGPDTIGANNLFENIPTAN